MSLKPFLFVAAFLVVPAPWARAMEEPPLGLEEVPHPETNVPGKAKIDLGKKLFFDKLLSRDGSVSCATCHVPEQAFAQKGVAVSKGIDGKIGRRNAPSLLNVGFAKKLFLDGRSPTLEDQAWRPILADDEMGNRSEKEVLERLGASKDYRSFFKNVFGTDKPDRESVAKALASYQRTLVSGNSPFDQWNWGESKALSKAARTGYELFIGRAQCWQCHPLNSDSSAVLFTDHQFHETGVSAHNTKLAKGKSGDKEKGSPAVKKKDHGRFEVTKRPSDRFVFKTPSLRNVNLTPPYMHDGSIKTLKEVVQFYNRAENSSELQPLSLTDTEIDSLVAFLESLTGDQRNENESVKKERMQKMSDE